LNTERPGLEATILIALMSGFP